MMRNYIALGLALTVFWFGPVSAQMETAELCRAFVKEFPREDIREQMAGAPGTHVYAGRTLLYYAAVLGFHGYLRDEVSRVSALVDLDPEILVDSVAADELDSVRILIEAGVDSDHRKEGGPSAIMVAVGCRRTDILKYLIDVGADIHVRNQDGIDAMIHAVMENNLEAIDILLESGFDLERSRTRHGLSPVDVALRMKNERVLERLQYPVEK
jgi:hypothetical protein